jgi:hypothetical protein
MKTLLTATTLVLFWTTGLAQKTELKVNLNYISYRSILNKKNIANSLVDAEAFPKDSSRWEKGWNRHPTRKIIAGSISIIYGAFLISESVTYKETNFPGSPNKNLAIFQAVSGGAFLTFGTVAIIKGVNLKRQNKLKIGMTNNGISVIFKI